MEKTKLIKNPLKKKRANLISDKHQLNQHNIFRKDKNNFDEIIINIKSNHEKNKTNLTNNEYEQRKIKLKLPGEILCRNKGIDYIILNGKKKSIKNKNTNSELLTLNNMYKENYENKKKLEDLINNFSLKKKNNANNNDNLILNNDNSINNHTLQNKENNNESKTESKNDIYFNDFNISSNREIKKEESEETKSIVSTVNNNGNYLKKKPYYALDNKIYYKNKNIEKNTPFKHKIINSRVSFTKKRSFNTTNNNNNNQNFTNITETINDRNTINVNPIHLTYINNNIGSESVKNVCTNSNNIFKNKKNFYIKIGRNNIFKIKKDMSDINNDNNKNNNDNNDIKSNSSYSKIENATKRLKENIKNYNDKKEKGEINNKINPLYVKIAKRKINSNVEDKFYRYKKNPHIINYNNNNNNNNNNNSNNSNSNATNTGLNRKHHSFNKHSFKFLVQQTNKNRELSLSFNKRYKSKNTTINNNETNNDSLSFSNIYNETDLNNDQESNKPSLMYCNSIFSDNRYSTDNEKKKNMKYEYLKTYKTSSELVRKNRPNNNIENKYYYNKVINDDYIEFKPISDTNRKEQSLNKKKENKEKEKERENSNIETLTIKNNEYNAPKKRSSYMMFSPQNKIVNYKVHSNHSSSSLNNCYNSFINMNKEKKSTSDISISSINTNFYSFINLELLYFFEEKMKKILEKIKTYEECSKECHLFINYYFVHNFYIEELRVFKINKNREFMINYLKMEILCYFLLYNISSGDKFKEVKIILQSIFEILFNNFLLFISLIISQIENKDNNLVNDLKKVIKEDLNIDLLKEVSFNFYNLDESKFIEILVNNSKNINDYYKMIINNFYTNNSNENNVIKFPDCIYNNNKELDKSKLDSIISSFFIESYKSLPNFNFDTFKKFYYSFLCFNEFEEKNNNNIFEDNMNKNTTIDQNKDKKFMLPEIKDGKKYSLILDLDETIIYSQRKFNYKVRKSDNRINKKKIILRPGLYEFLHEMKQLFELIVFSSGTPDYVDPIIKIIEKNEKYFDHILYRHHITLDENGNNVKNLDLIGRDLSKVIIIDDIPRYFSLHKENGINIKPFCGNILSDTKTLKSLNSILKQIRIDAEETNDIRISLQKYKHLLYPSVINNIEE